MVGAPLNGGAIEGLMSLYSKIKTKDEVEELVE
jgi:hypothetical protein